MKQLITFFSILFLLAGCNNDNEHSKQSTVEFSVVAQGNPSPSQTQNISKSNLVIKDTESWNSLLSKMSTYETSRFSENNIDFTNYQIIVVFDQVYSNGGHSIDITKITEDYYSVFVKVEKLNKGNDATVVTQPYHIVKIAKTTKNIVFK